MYKNTRTSVILDIGDSKIAAICVEIISDSDFEVIHCNLYSPEGFQGGAVSDMQKASNNLTNIIYNIEKDYKKNVQEVILSISPQLLKSYYVTIIEKVEKKQIDKFILEKIYQKAINKMSFINKDILHYFPIEFLLDSNYLVDNPLGLVAQTIECKIHFITANSIILRNIVNCFASINIEVKEFILSSYAMGYNIKKQYKVCNSLIIDVGCKYSSFTVFYKNSPIYIDYIKLGGLDITKEISSRFLFSMDSAEKIKILYNNAVLNDTSKNEIIKTDLLDSDLDRQNTVLNSVELSESISKKLDQIFYNISNKYYLLGIEKKINLDTISLCGGCSNINMIKQSAIEHFSKPVRVINNDIGQISKNLNQASIIHVVNIAKFIACEREPNIRKKIELKNFWKWFIQ